MQTPTIEPLAAFLDRYRDADLHTLADAIAALVVEGGGAVITPEPGLHSPATADWEIECLGIYAKGFDRLNAARNWRKVALSCLYPEAA